MTRGAKSDGGSSRNDSTEKVNTSMFPETIKKFLREHRSPDRMIEVLIAQELERGPSVPDPRVSALASILAKAGGDIEEALRTGIKKAWREAARRKRGHPETFDVALTRGLIRRHIYEQGIPADAFFAFVLSESEAPEQTYAFPPLLIRVAKLSRALDERVRDSPNRDPKRGISRWKVSEVVVDGEPVSGATARRTIRRVLSEDFIYAKHPKGPAAKGRNSGR